MPDNRIIFAFDKQTARSRDADGRMRVKNCILSTAEINPYRGEEIPNYDRLGLKPNQVYDLYRDPDEMRKAAPTFEGVPLMIKHVAQTADEPRKEYQGGAVHSVRFDGKHLRGDLLVSDGKAIDMIESGAAADLSCGYRYVPDMQSGEVDGRRHDGVMRTIQGNHVALVDDGRASGAHVADSALFNPQGPDPTMQGVDDMSGKDELPAGGPPGSEAGEQHEGSAMAQVGQALKHIAGLLESIHGKLGGSAEPAEGATDNEEGREEGEGRPEGTEREPEGANDFELDPAVREEAVHSRAMDEESDGEGEEMEGAMDEEGEGDYPVPSQSAQNGTPARGEKTPHGAMDAKSVRTYAAQVAADAVARERRRAQAVEQAKRDTRGVLGDVYGMDSAGAIYREALKAVGQDVTQIPKGMARVAWNTHVAVAARTAGVRPQSEMALDAAGVEKQQAGVLAHLSRIKVKG
jgi:hypothetical protein